MRHTLHVLSRICLVAGIGVGFVWVKHYDASISLYVSMFALLGVSAIVGWNE